jgi:uncharacterized membrane protein YbhN (UPF0104 family)
VRAVARFRLASIEWTVIPAAALLIALLAVAIFLIGFESLESQLRKVDPATLGVCLVLMVWQLGCRFARWFWYARCLGLKIRPGEAALYYAGGLGMALTPGRLGETLRLWFLQKRFAVPYRRIVGLYVADRLSDTIGYLILLALGSAASASTSPIAAGGLVLVAALTAAIVYPRPVVALLTAGYAVVGRGRKLVLWLRRAIRNTAVLLQPPVFLPGLAIGTVGWLAPPAVLALSLSAMGIALDPWHAIAIYAAAALAGGATMLPGGGGGTEAVMVGLLLAADVPLDAAVTAMLVTRVAFLWLPVGLGIAVLPVAMKAARKVANR